MKTKDFNSRAESLHSQVLGLFADLEKVWARISKLEEENPNQEIIENLKHATPHREQLENLLIEASRLWCKIKEIGIERRKIFKQLMETPASEVI